MAPLRAFAIEWNVASDDFVCAGFTGFIVHLIGIILLAIGYSFYQRVFATCSCCIILQIFLIGMLIITSWLAIADFGIGWVSSQGSISSPGLRRYLPYWLYFRALLTIPEVIWVSLGTYWAFYSNSSPCLQLESDLLKIAVIVEWCLITLIILILPCAICPPARSKPNQLSGDQARRALKRLFRCLFCYRDLDNHPSSNRQCLCCLPLLCISCLPNYCQCDQSDGSEDGIYAAMSEVLTSIFYDMNTAPSDIAAGLVLVNRQQKKDQLRHEVQAATITRNNRKALTKFDYNTYDDRKVLSDLCYYYDYTTAIYGWPLYLLKNSICHHGAICSLCRSCCFERSSSQETIIIEDNSCHCNQTAVRGLIQQKAYEVLYASYRNKLYETPFLLAVDHSRKSVVVSIRGTLSLIDLAADMIATPIKLLVDGVEDAYTHQGITKCAENIKQKLDENNLLAIVMKQHSSYRLIITGHSLGAGAAAILSILLRRDYPKLLCYAYSPPGGLVSSSLRTYTEGFIVSMVVGYDVIPRLSRQNLRKLRHEILTQLQDCPLPKYKILSTSRCCCCCCCAQFTLGCLLNCTEADLENGQPPVNSYTLPDSDIIELFPPGKIAYLTDNRHFNTTEETGHTAYWSDHLVFDKILMAGAMMSDHRPLQVGKALNDISDMLSQCQVKFVTTV
ncbi:Sn1-specific diacylglycerol lipase beta [Trichoplax sp. H2]|nr:Sn1-specific diacylglycerol lipase beta [Trichoplax sp. H2]|eukprot:RDD45324.1 Sn1-specific diacylglycerol lipase beta [Trichoplax sp. H2]